MISQGKFRHYSRLYDKEKIPRKAKLMILGRKMKRTELRKKIKDFKVIQKGTSLNMPTLYNMMPFCPKCGCEQMRSTGNMSEYPELYEICFCLRCGEKVMEADNSIFYHVLEG